MIVVLGKDGPEAAKIAEYSSSCLKNFKLPGNLKDYIFTVFTILCSNESIQWKRLICLGRRSQL